MTTLATLVVKIVGDISQYTEALNKSAEMTETFSGRALSGMSALGGGLVTGALASAAALVGGVGVAAWTAGNQVDEAMDTIATKTGATGAVLAGLEGTFKSVFSNVPTDAQAAAGVIGELNTRLEMSGPILEQSSTKLLKMSDLLGGDAPTNAGLFSRVIGDWSVPLGESSALLDKLFVASQKTGVGTDSLMQNVVQFGAPLRNMGFELNDAIALFAKWEKEGVNAELVMGSLRQAAGKFANENKPLKQGLEETMAAIKGAGSNSEALSIAMGVFGARAAGDMSAAIREGRFDIEDLTAAMESAEGSIDKTAKATEDWPEKWKRFSNGLTVSLAPLGGTMMGIAGQAMDMLNSFLAKPEVQTFIAETGTVIQTMADTAITWLPQVTEWFQKAFGWLDENKGVVAAALAMIGAAVLLFAYSSLAASIPAIGAFIVAAWPVVLVLGLVGVAAYLLYEAWTNNWGGIQEKLGAVWGWMQGIFSQLQAWLKNELPIHLTALGILWETKFLPKIQAVWAWIDTNLMPLFSALGELLGNVLRLALDGLGLAWDRLKGPLGTVSDLVQKYLVWSFGNLRSIIEFLAPYVSGAVNWAFSGLTGVIQGVTRAIETLNRALGAVKLPKALTPGSPTPFEIGLRGIGDALDGLNGKSLPNLRAGLQFETAGAAGVGAQIAPRIANGQQGAASARELTFNYYDHAVVSSNRENEIIDKLGPAFVAFLRQQGLK